MSGLHLSEDIADAINRAKAILIDQGVNDNAAHAIGMARVIRSELDRSWGNDTLKQVYDSGTFNNEFKFELSQATLDFDASLEWAYGHYEKRPLISLLGNNRLPLKHVPAASTNLAFSGRYTAIALANAARRGHAKPSHLINRFLAEAVEEIFTPEFVGYFISYGGKYNLERVYHHARRILEVDESLPESWVRKLWYGQYPNDMVARLH